MTKARDLANASTALSAVSATELAFVDGVTSAIQTQMDAKAPSSTAVTLTGTQTLTNKTLTSPVIASVVNNTLTSTTGDMIYASAANTPARLGIGSTGQVLTVASGIPSWATPAAGGVTLVTSGTFTSVTSFAVNSAFTSTYKNYSMFVNLSADTTQSTVLFRYRLSGTDSTANQYYGGQFGYSAGGTLTSGFANPSTSLPLKNVHSIGAGWGLTGIEFKFFDPSSTTANNAHPFTADSFDPAGLNNRWVGGGQLFVSSAAYDGFSLSFSNACTGFYRIYGWG